MILRDASRNQKGERRLDILDAHRVLELEQVFVVADSFERIVNGDSGAEIAASKVVDFYRRTATEDVSAHFKLDRNLSYAGNRLVGAIRMANVRLFEAIQRDIARAKDSLEGFAYEWDAPAASVVAASFCFYP